MENHAIGHYNYTIQKKTTENQTDKGLCIITEEKTF